MKDKVKDMFAQITMPQETEQKIRKTMMEGRKSRKQLSGGLQRVMAVAAMLALILLISPTARAAVSDWVVKYVFPDSGITIYEEKDIDGNTVEIMAVDTEHPAFAHMENGRLYFTGNGEYIDITDQITEEQPFYYTFVEEEYGLTHYMVVGYHGSLENFGIYEFLREEEEGQQSWEGWSNGYGRNFLNPETEMCYPWVNVVWNDLKLPWPVPGT